MSLRLPISRRNNPSAIGLRQILPVQTKRTRFTVSALRWRTRKQLKFEPANCRTGRADILWERMLTLEKKTAVRGDYRRRWMSDDYFDLIVWYKVGNTIHGFQLCYGKPRLECALTWLKEGGFIYAQIDSGAEVPEANRTPILVPDGSFPTADVTREFRR